MSKRIEILLTQTESGWTMKGEEYKDGELCGASDVKDARISDCLAIITMVCMDNDSE